jgi:hypothetical protein
MKTNKKRLLFALALAFILIMAFTGCELIEEAKDKPSGNGGQGDTNTTPSTNYSWIMEPKLDYDDIYYCNPSACSAFYAYAVNNVEAWIISPETGEKIEKHMGHGNPTLNICYETKTKEFYLPGIGYDNDYVINNFKKWASDVGYLGSSDLLGIQARDANKYAVASIDGLLITDFIFDDREDNYNPTLAVKQNGKWGFVDSSGKFFIEPIFDGAVSIDKDKAFVKQNGKWGIIRKGA